MLLCYLLPRVISLIKRQFQYIVTECHAVMLIFGSFYMVIAYNFTQKILGK